MQPAYTAPAKEGSGMAIASVILGILSIPMMILCLCGVPVALLAILLGLIHLMSGSRAGRMTAAAGIGSSVLALILGGIMMWWGSTLIFAPAAENARVQAFANNTAPALSGTSHSGEQVSLANLSGNPVVVLVLPDDEFQSGMGLAITTDAIQQVPDLELIVVSDKSEEFFEKLEGGGSFPVISPKGLPEAYQTKTDFPILYYINDQGVVEKVGVGVFSIAMLIAELKKDFE